MLPVPLSTLHSDPRRSQCATAHINTHPVFHATVTFEVTNMIPRGLSTDPELDNSSRPLRLSFYLSLRSEGTASTDKCSRS